MNVIDSSCWLEYFAGSEIADQVGPAIEDVEYLVVPSIVLYEVFKKLLIEVGEDKALLAVAHMKQGRVVELDADLALFAARIGRDSRLPLADSVIYATALQSGARLWTADAHFEGLDSVSYFPREK